MRDSAPKGRGGTAEGGDAEGLLLTILKIAIKIQRNAKRYAM